MDFLAPWVQWILAFHVMAFISWMAGIFYLPRLFVYNTQAVPGSAEYIRFCLMERRLLRQIMRPAMVVTIITGALMASVPGVIDWSAPWWWIKLACVVGLVVFQLACGVWQRGFAQQRNYHQERFYRIINEVPTILMMVLVIMIVVRPSLSL
ncbi:protoporphyrinogen oxidase HemJ [Formicincola oecophyllae]|uniref:Protoporphyrinogen IX oxidase n=1 Tax=Formicincola oecophyllae TaxID=2558361 RepID=A0A4Y6U7W4_9PROT|nr:protoporphyrinogen oxidase HemJ [Formicincola oecophyllae]QDH13523.1 protoporphyrinogen oxidase HemJ [Formicincola oecophyllae]